MQRVCLGGIVLFGMLMCLGGCASQWARTKTPTSAFICWTDDLVCIVADGDVPGELPGFRDLGGARRQKGNLDTVRLTTPSRALEMLRIWAKDEPIRFALLALSPDDIHWQDDNAPAGFPRPGYPDVPDDFLMMARLSTKELRATFLIIVAPPDRADELRRKLTKLGLIDDTIGYVERSVAMVRRGLEAMRSLFGCDEGD